MFIHWLQQEGCSLSSSWIGSVDYKIDDLLVSWRRAVIKLLRVALRAGQLLSASTADELETVLDEQEKRWWSVKIKNFKSREHFLIYAGRYLRRPPIAECRITYVRERTVSFWYKDKKPQRKVYVQCSPEEFVERWSQHIPERYRHAVRHFRLFAPRSVRETHYAVFAVLERSEVVVPNLGLGRNPLSVISDGTLSWT